MWPAPKMGTAPFASRENYPRVVSQRCDFLRDGVNFEGAFFPRGVLVRKGHFE